MKIKIWVPDEIEIPADEFPGLARKVREDWEQGENEPVYMVDMLNAAVASGVCAPPEGFEVDGEWDDPLTDDEIAEFEDE